MRKFIYIAALLLLSSLTITSCTEETVAPKHQTNESGGGFIDPVKP